MGRIIGFSLIFIAGIGFAVGTQAANQYWDPSTNASYQHGDGIWSTAPAETNWGANATSARTTWANGNRAYFSAINGTSLITLNSAVTSTNVQMAGSVYTLMITNGGTLDLSVGGASITGSDNTFIVNGQGSWWNFNNSILTLGNNTTASNNTLVIDQGGAVSNISTLTVGTNNSVQFSGGNLGVSNVTWNTHGLFTVGDGTQVATLTARGGNLNFQNGLLVNSNATLTGYGTVNGGTYGVVMTNGSSLTVGDTNSITTLTLRNSATWYGGMTMNLNITNVAGTAGIDWDLVRIVGDLALTPNGGKLKIKLDSLGETAGGFDPDRSRIVKLVEFASTALSLADIELDVTKFLIGGSWTLEVTAADIRYVYQRSVPAIYVSNNGDNTVGTNWTTAFQTLSNAWNYVQDLDTVYVAGQTFLTTQIVLSAKYGVSIFGGYAATNDAVLPGPNDAAQWPTVLQRDPTVDETRILYLSGLAKCILKNFTIQDGYISTAANGAGVYISNCDDLTLDSFMIISNRLVNQVTKGAGAYVASGRVNITDSLIVSNSILTTSGNPTVSGGGLYLDGGTTTVTRSTIAGNKIRSTYANLSYGGGLYLSANAVGVMRQTVITGNISLRHATYGTKTRGGGVYNLGSLLLENCLIDHNWDDQHHSDGIYSAGTLTLLNCTVADNGGANGYGIYRGSGTIGMTNSIVWGHLDDIFGFTDNGGIPLIVSNVYYCCIQDEDNKGEQNCMSLDPLFVDRVYYHLQSTASNYVDGYFSGGEWSTAPSNSPAIDAGDPGIVLTEEPEPNKGIVNMGAYGNTAVASLSPTIIAELPVITNLGATVFGHRTVTLNAAVTDTGGDTPTCWFEYWEVDSVVTSSASAGLQVAVFSKNVSDLTPDSAYQFRVVASNVEGAVFSDVKTFNTHPVPSVFYVGTNGNNTAGTNWSTAYNDPQSAFSATEDGDTVYLAGHTFEKAPDLNEVNVWTWGGVSDATVIGGYAAASEAALPGTNDPMQWPTVLKRASGDARILLVSGLTNSILRGVTIQDGLYTAAASGGGLYASGCASLILDTCIFTNNIVSGNPGRGGGLYLVNGSLLVTNCLFTRNAARGTSNQAGHGGGIYTGFGANLVMTDSLVITNTAQGSSNQKDPGYGGGFYFASGSTSAINRTVISRNRALSTSGVDIGGGMFNSGGQVSLQNCLVVMNDAADDIADGIRVSSGSMNILNCTVADNSGVGVECTGGTLGVTNSILWGNGVDLTGTVAVAYCNIQAASDSWTNNENGCISTDPLFVDQVYYHLQSKIGCYLDGYFSGGTWGNALAYSECIDTGYPDPTNPWIVEPAPNGRRSNIGAYGNTEVASKSLTPGTIFMFR